MLVTTIICTYRREQRLLEALESLAAQELPAGDSMELLVVDNDETAGGPRRLQRLLQDSCPEARVVWEAETGIMHARNRGVLEAVGDVVAFLDDDACAQPGWATALVTAFRRPGVQIATGPVLPRWEAPPPRWLLDCGRHVMLTHSLSQLSEGPLPNGVFPPGCNMAFRRQLFDRGARFALMGHRGTDEIGAGDESELIARLLGSGVVAPEGIWYCHGMAVTHLYPKERMTLRHCLARQHAEGRASALCDRARSGRLAPLRIGLARAGLNVLRDLPILARATLSDDQRRVPLALNRMQKTRGYLSALLSMWLNRRLG